MPNDLNDLFDEAARPPRQSLDVDAIHLRASRARRIRRGIAAASALLLMLIAVAAITRPTGEGATDVSADEDHTDADGTSAVDDRSSTTGAAEPTTTSTTGASAAPVGEASTTTTVPRCPQQGGPPGEARDVKQISADFDGDGAADTLYSYRRPDLTHNEGLWVRITLTTGAAAERAILADFSPYGSPSAERSPTPLGGADLFGDGRAIAFLYDSSHPDSPITFVPYFWRDCVIGIVERDGVVAGLLLNGGQYAPECVGSGRDGFTIIERERDTTRPEPGYSEFRSVWRSRERIERIDRTPARFVETTDDEPLHHFRCGGLTLSHYPSRSEA